MSGSGLTYTTTSAPTAPVNDPSVPQPISALPPDARQQAYANLLSQASARGDNGDSSKTMLGILNRVDMSGAQGTSDIWSQRNAASQAAGQSLLSRMGSAQQMKLARGSGGGGGARVMQQPTYSDWLQQQYDALKTAGPGMPGGPPVAPGRIQGQGWNIRMPQDYGQYTHPTTTVPYQTGVAPTPSPWQQQRQPTVGAPGGAMFSQGPLPVKRGYSPGRAGGRTG